MIGNTWNLVEPYRLLAVLRLLVSWVVGGFADWVASTVGSEERRLESRGYWLLGLDESLEEGRATGLRAAGKKYSPQMRYLAECNIVYYVFMLYVSTEASSSGLGAAATATVRPRQHRCTSDRRPRDGHLRPACRCMYVRSCVRCDAPACQSLP